ncbi:MAG: TerC family protein, partial [Burkholderiales bacterium]
VLKLVERFPIIIQAGAAVLAYTAAQMVIGEQLLKPWIEPLGFAKYGVHVVAIVLVLGLGTLANRRRKGQSEAV